MSAVTVPSILFLDGSPSWDEEANLPPVHEDPKLEDIERVALSTFCMISSPCLHLVIFHLKDRATVRSFKERSSCEIFKQYQTLMSEEDKAHCSKQNACQVPNGAMLEELGPAPHRCRKSPKISIIKF